MPYRLLASKKTDGAETEHTWTGAKRTPVEAVFRARSLISTRPSRAKAKAAAGCVSQRQGGKCFR
jgi:hypothetical protein